MIATRRLNASRPLQSSTGATYFSDGTTQAYAFRSCGVVDDDHDVKTLKQESNNSVEILST